MTEPDGPKISPSAQKGGKLQLITVIKTKSRYIKLYYWNALWIFLLESYLPAISKGTKNDTFLRFFGRTGVLYTKHNIFTYCTRCISK